MVLSDFMILSRSTHYVFLPLEALLAIDLTTTTDTVKTVLKTRIGIFAVIGILLTRF